MTIEKYTHCLILKICVFLKIQKKQNKKPTTKTKQNMQVSLRSNRFARSYFLRLDYQFSFPNEVQLRQGFPQQISLTNETDNDTKTTETKRELRPN